MPDTNLVIDLKNLVREERKITSQILEYLREVERRKLFLTIGFPSLYEFCTRELGYSEGSTHRRIASMRLINEIPIVKEKIASGELSLSVVAQAQTFFKKQSKKNEPYASTQKLELLEKLQHTSTRECEKVLLELDPEIARCDRARQISPELTELRLTVDKTFIEMIERLKNLLSHSRPDISTKEVLQMGLETLLVKKNAAPLPSAREVAANPVRDGIADPVRKETTKRTRYISQKLKRQIWHKHNGQCGYRDQATGRMCGAKKFLEIDHVLAYSRGGANTFENLQLLCSSHNVLKGANW
jgi:hypothetical protein